MQSDGHFCLAGLSNSFRISGTVRADQESPGGDQDGCLQHPAVIKGLHVAPPPPDIISPRPISEVDCNSGGNAQMYPCIVFYRDSFCIWKCFAQSNQVWITMDEDQIEVRVEKLENLPITGRFDFG